MRPLADIAERYPGRTALIDGMRRWTWEELRERALGLAVSLHSLHGIRSGDIVATQLGNTAEHVFLLHAIWILGATAAPLNTRLLAMERDRQLEHLRPALLLLDPADSPPDRVLNIPVCNIDDLLPAAANGSDIERAISPEQRCSILFTSGSSGVPKAVPHSWSNHQASAMASAINLGTEDDDNWQCVIPLYHIGGLAILTRGVLYGMATTLHDGFDVSSVATALRRDGVRITSLVPTMLHRLLEEDPEFNSEQFPQLRAILLGGAPASRDLWSVVRERRLPVLGTYGMTESCSQVVTASPERQEKDAQTAGRPLPGVELQIRNDAGLIVEDGDEGEIWLRGPMMTSGYLHHDGLNSQRYVNGWFRTDDIGVLDADGRLHVLSRRGDMIISGGENIHPAEITEVLLRHPDVADAAIIGIDDEEWGQRPAAVLVLRRELMNEDLEQWCREHLAGYKVPHRWSIVETLPRTATGKLLRAELRTLFSGEI